MTLFLARLIFIIIVLHSRILTKGDLEAEKCYLVYIQNVNVNFLLSFFYAEILFF